MGVHVGLEGDCPLPFKSVIIILRTLQSALQYILSDKGTNFSNEKGNFISTFALFISYIYLSLSNKSVEKQQYNRT